MTRVLIRREETQTQTHEGKAPFDNRGRDLSATAARQGMPRIAGKPSETRKNQGRILLYRFQREHGPANTLILDFKPLKL